MRLISALLVDIAILFFGMAALFLTDGSAPIGAVLLVIGCCCVGTIGLWRKSPPLAKPATLLLTVASYPVSLLWLIAAVPMFSWNHEAPPLSGPEEAVRWVAMLLLIANLVFLLGMTEKVRKLSTSG